MFYIVLMGLVLVLMWAVMSAPIGKRTVVRDFVVDAERERVWQAVYPFGDDYGWNQATASVTQTGPSTGHMVTTHTGRDGNPIERDFVLSGIEDGAGYVLQYTSDTSLAQDFWENHTYAVRLSDLGAGKTRVTVSETDSYKGFAFLVFRFFALRRMAIKLDIWLKTGTFRKGGIFEKPVTQLGMAVVSALIMWPLFGMTATGLFFACALTTVVGLHELGHMAAFRLMGHREARMIFIPILGGIALGGRPYDTHFEIGFSALMGAGFSAFLAAFLMFAHLAMGAAFAPQFAEGIIVAALMMSLFNLANLIPVWKFDGGQVLRQVFRSSAGLAAAAFVALSWFALTGFAVGLPAKVIMGSCAIFAVLSLMTTQSGVRPKTPLTPMTGLERFAILAAFAAVFAIHSIVFAWSVEALFA